jgi:hypothetical protein
LSIRVKPRRLFKGLASPVAARQGGGAGRSIGIKNSSPLGAGRAVPAQMKNTAKHDRLG